MVNSYPKRCHLTSSYFSLDTISKNEPEGSVNLPQVIFALSLMIHKQRGSLVQQTPLGINAAVFSQRAVASTTESSFVVRDVMTTESGFVVRDVMTTESSFVVRDVMTTESSFLVRDVMTTESSLVVRDVMTTESSFVFFYSKCSLFHNSNKFGSCIIHIFIYRMC